MSDTIIPPGMGRCEVTGKIVPEDELVTLSGQRVCAEGKAILLDRLKAGEAMPGEAERPSFGQRFGSSLLDGIIMGAVGFALGFGIGIAMVGSMVGVGLAQIFAGAIQLAYFTFMHGTRGQTLGKMAGKIKVVRMDGKPMDMTTGFIRALAYSGTNILYGILIIVGLAQVGSVIVVIYGLANAITLLSDKAQQRSIHDRIAGTRVIKLNA